MPLSRRPPQVTGISPKEGPPGTRVTIRGENLGVDARDLTGVFCWQNLSWFLDNLLTVFLLAISIWPYKLLNSFYLEKEIFQPVFIQ